MIRSGFTFNMRFFGTKDIVTYALPFVKDVTVETFKWYATEALQSEDVKKQAKDVLLHFLKKVGKTALVDAEVVVASEGGGGVEGEGSVVVAQSNDVVSTVSGADKPI
eukprot:gene29970-37112_t